MRILWCWNCDHCWVSLKKKEAYQCSRCKSRDVVVVPSLTAFRDAVRKKTIEDMGSGVDTTTASFPVPTSGAGKKVHRDSGSSPLEVSPGISPKISPPSPAPVEDVVLDEQWSKVYLDWKKYERYTFEINVNVNWLQGRTGLNRFTCRDREREFRVLYERERLP